MAYSIKQANDYINTTRNTVENKYKPRFHVSPPIGWMNDPNGLCYFRGKYRLFYQFNPYAANPEAMHWGYFVSYDLIEFTDRGVAMCPTENDETDCFSGGGIVSGGVLNLIYTRHYEIKDIKKEQVCIVKSLNGREFNKHVQPVFDNETLPGNISRTEFRDPFPVQVGDKFYVFVGGKDVATNKGVIVVLCGNSLDKLEYDFTIGPYYELGDMAECPCYCKIDGKDVLIVSGCHVDERDGCYKNTHASVFIVGTLDFVGKTMQVEYIKEIDKGDTFYAPQIINGAETPTIIGWQEMWNKPYPTREFNHGWVGALTIPRELKMVDGDIIQTPISALDKYSVKTTDTNNLGDCFCIDAVIGRGGTLIIRGENGVVTIGNDGSVYLDTQNANNLNGCIRRVNVTENKCAVKILVDVSCIEVFVDGGKYVISSRMYIDGNKRLIADGEVADISVFKIDGIKEQGGQYEE